MHRRTYGQVYGHAREATQKEGDENDEEGGREGRGRSEVSEVGSEKRL